MTYPTPFKDYTQPIVVADPVVTPMIKKNPPPDPKAATKLDVDGDFDGSKERMIDKLRSLRDSSTK